MNFHNKTLITDDFIFYLACDNKEEAKKIFTKINKEKHQYLVHKIIELRMMFPFLSLIREGKFLEFLEEPYAKRLINRSEYIWN